MGVAEPAQHLSRRLVLAGCSVERESLLAESPGLHRVMEERGERRRRVQAVGPRRGGQIDGPIECIDIPTETLGDAPARRPKPSQHGSQPQGKWVVAALKCEADCRSEVV